MFTKRKLLIEYRKLLIKNIKLDNKLKRRQIALKTIDLWEFQQLKVDVAERFNNEPKESPKTHI